MNVQPLSLVHTLLFVSAAFASAERRSPPKCRPVGTSWKGWSSVSIATTPTSLPITISSTQTSTSLSFTPSTTIITSLFTTSSITQSPTITVSTSVSQSTETTTSVTTTSQTTSVAGLTTSNGSTTTSDKSTTTTSFVGSTTTISSVESTSTASSGGSTSTTSSDKSTTSTSPSGSTSTTSSDKSTTTTSSVGSTTTTNAVESTTSTSSVRSTTSESSTTSVSGITSSDTTTTSTGSMVTITTKPTLSSTCGVGGNFNGQAAYTSTFTTNLAQTTAAGQILPTATFAPADCQTFCREQTSMVALTFGLNTNGCYCFATSLQDTFTPSPPGVPSSMTYYDINCILPPETTTTTSTSEGSTSSITTTSTSSTSTTMTTTLPTTTTTSSTTTTSITTTSTMTTTTSTAISTTSVTTSSTTTSTSTLTTTMSTSTTTTVDSSTVSTTTTTTTTSIITSSPTSTLVACVYNGFSDACSSPCQCTPDADMTHYYCADSQSSGTQCTSDSDCTVPGEFCPFSISALGQVSYCTNSRQQNGDYCALAPVATTPAGPPVCTNIIVDGGFEQIPSSDLGQPDITTGGWTFSGQDVYPTTYSQITNYGRSFGNNVAYFGFTRVENTDYSISQQLSGLAVGAQYTLSFYTDTPNFDGNSQCFLTVDYGLSQVAVAISTEADAYLNQQSYNFVPGISAAQLQFQFACDGEAAYAVIDQVSLQRTDSACVG